MEFNRESDIVTWNYKTPLEFQIVDVFSGDATETHDDVENDIDTVYGESDDESDPEEYTPPTPKKSATKILPYLITLYGVTEMGKSVALEVQNYKPHFYIEIPYGAPKTAVHAIKQILKKGIYPAAYDKVMFEEVKKGKLYGYTNRAKFNFLRVEVPNMSVFYRMRKQLLTKKSGSSKNFMLPGFHKPAKLEIYETNIDPVLKFFHGRDAKPAGWIRIPSGQYEASETETNCQLSMKCDWTAVEALNDKISVAPLIIASWDIECGSSHGDFPLAIKTFGKVATEAYELIHAAKNAGETLPNLSALIEEAIWPAFVPELQGMSRLHIKKECDCCGYTNPTCKRKKTRLPTTALSPMAVTSKIKTYVDYIRARIGKNIPESVWAKEKHSDRIGALANYLDMNLSQEIPIMGDEVIQIGTCLKRLGESTTEKHIFTLKSCNKIPGAFVYSFEKESELLLAWAKFVKRVDPDIMIGYNISAFDERYLYERAQECGCSDEFGTALGRIPGRPAKLEIKELSSAAMGQNKMATIEMPGRVRIDLFHYIKRNYALESYKLDSVAAVFMASDVIEATVGDKLIDKASPCKSGEYFTLKSKSVEGLRVGHYITLTDSLGEPVDHKYVVSNIIDKSVVCKNDSGDPIESIPKSWSQAKDDIHPKDIFRLQRGTAADRAIVAKYCIQDCDLVMDIESKLKAFMNAMAMANVCSVPVSFIFNRGQGIKIESLIFKECGINNILIKVLPKPRQNEVQVDAAIGSVPDEDEEEDPEEEDESYEGAVVLKPKTGFYGDKSVVVLDYASLYPSSMISENISHDALVWVRDYDIDGTWTNKDTPDATSPYDNIPSVRYIDIEYDILKPDPLDMFTRTGKPKKHPRQIKMGMRVCRYAQFPGEEKGTMGVILKKLLGARKATRNAAAKEDKDSFKYALLDMMQNAYKITANSLYGQLGSATSKIRCVPLAASTTAYGRKQIMFSKAVIEELWAGRADCNAEAVCVYGDSVVGDTGLVIKDENGIRTVRIDELVQEARWIAHHETKEMAILEKPTEVWTDTGFTKIQQVIRHRLHPDKKLMRVLTHTGIVDCTSDHSLVLEDGKEAKPTDIGIGTKLMHNHNLHKEITETSTDITINEAWVMGFFVADGSSDVYDCPSGKKASWAINKANLDLLNEAKERAPFPTKILNTLESSGVYKLVPVGNIVTTAAKYRKLFYNSHREKVIPDCILNAPIDIVRSFWEGFYAGDGDKDKNGYCRFDQKGKQGCTAWYLLAQRLGYNVSINERADKPDVFRLTMTTKTQRKAANAVKKIRELIIPAGERPFVYDLTTENHHFGVGPGSLVVHNTDSLFIAFNPKDPETGKPLTGWEGVEASVRIGEEAGHLISSTLKAPQDFEFDKVFWPFVLLSKKRYVGHMYEEPEKGIKSYKVKPMGIALKRRDNAPIVKEVYWGAVKAILEKRSIPSACEFIKTRLMELACGKIPLRKLLISKSLKATYANRASIAHAVLADRIGIREPGSAPQSGDRLTFAYVLPAPGEPMPTTQGERIETPGYIAERKLRIDYKHYITNQLFKPIGQFMAAMLENIPGFEKLGRSSRYYDSIEEKEIERQRFTKGRIDEKAVHKKVEEMRMKDVEKLLFSDALRVATHSATGQQMIAFDDGGVTIVKRRPRDGPAHP